MNSKILVNCFISNYQCFEKCALKNIKKWGGGGGSQEFYHRFMYKALSSDSSLLTLNLPFKVILRRFDVSL